MRRIYRGEQQRAARCRRTDERCIIDWTAIAAVGAGALLILVWIGLEEWRRRWKRAFRRRRCPHPDPCLDGRYRGREPGWAREVYYCPDCKHLWARRVAVSPEEWERLGEAEPAPSPPPFSGT